MRLLFFTHRSVFGQLLKIYLKSNLQEGVSAWFHMISAKQAHKGSYNYGSMFEKAKARSLFRFSTRQVLRVIKETVKFNQTIKN